MPSPTSRRQNSSSPLHKGSACLNCRRRKIKCDASKPRCGPCAMSDGFRDCEYADAGVTRTQILEEQIAILETKIQELEAPGYSNPSVLLLQPYNMLNANQQFEQNLNFDQFMGISGQFPCNTGPQLPIHSHPSILHTFIRHSSTFGFFLNPTRFSSCALSSDSGDLPPSPALLSAALLWGVHLSGVQFAEYEASCLTKALSDTSQALSSPHPRSIIQYIQAEVLLAHYFFRNNRIIEGKYHTSAAMSLLFSAGYHKIRSIDELSPLGSSNVAQVPPSDLIEEGERINAFWTVIILNSCWSTRESNVLFEIVDTPWPLDMQQYSQVFRSPSFKTSRTIESFLSNQTSGSSGRDTHTERSVIAQYSKAAILLEEASKLGVLFTHQLGPSQTAKFLASFTALQTMIEEFRQILIPIHSMKSVVGLGTAITIHLLVHTAIIQLHTPVVDVNPTSRASIVTAVRSVHHILERVDFSQVFPVETILGTLVATTCRALVIEVLRGRSVPGYPSEPSKLLDSMMWTMSVLKSQNQYFDYLNTEVNSYYLANLG